MTYRRVYESLLGIDFYDEPRNEIEQRPQGSSSERVRRPSKLTVSTICAWKTGAGPDNAHHLHNHIGVCHTHSLVVDTDWP